MAPGPCTSKGELPPGVGTEPGKGNGKGNLLYPLHLLQTARMLARGDQPHRSALLLGWTRHGMAWHSISQHGTVWQGMAQNGTTQHSVALHGTAWHGTVLHGTVLHCMVQHGTAPLHSQHAWCCCSETRPSTQEKLLGQVSSLGQVFPGGHRLLGAGTHVHPQLCQSPRHRVSNHRAP